MRVQIDVQHAQPRRAQAQHRERVVVEVAKALRAVRARVVHAARGVERAPPGERLVRRLQAAARGGRRARVDVGEPGILEHAEGVALAVGLRHLARVFRPAHRGDVGGIVERRQLGFARLARFQVLALAEQAAALGELLRERDARDRERVVAAVAARSEARRGNEARDHAAILPSLTQRVRT